MFRKAPDVKFSTDFQTRLTLGSVFSQIARLHHFSPLALPSLVAHLVMRTDCWLVLQHRSCINFLRVHTGFPRDGLSDPCYRGSAKIATQLFAGAPNCIRWLGLAIKRGRDSDFALAIVRR